MPASENSAVEQRQRHDRGHQARRDQIVHGIDGQRVERVDLLGDGHVADGGRIAEPARAVTMSAVSTGASSRVRLSATSEPTRFSLPKRTSTLYPCSASTSPVKIADSATTPIERAPMKSSCAAISTHAKRPARRGARRRRRRTSRGGRRRPRTARAFARRRRRPGPGSARRFVPLLPRSRFRPFPLREVSKLRSLGQGRNTRSNRWCRQMRRAG